MKTSNQKATDTELVNSYRELKSVWLVGNKFNMSGQAVWEKLKKLKISLKGEKLSATEKHEIIKCYTIGFKTGDGKLKELSKKINRPITTISRAAREMGLSNYNRKVSKKLKADMSERQKNIITKNGHPKGAKGLKHSIETRKILGEKSKRAWGKKTKREIKAWSDKSIETKKTNNTLTNKSCSNPHSRTKGGKRKDLNNIFFRSAWEANIARYFNHLGIKWEYEPKCFIFQKIKRGVISYTPDFYLTVDDKWIEVKGWMDKNSKTRLRRFKKYYPAEFSKLEIIDQGRYNEIAKKARKIIKNWE